MKKTSLFFVLIILIFSGCKDDCNDPFAINYEEAANGVEDCVYGPPIINVNISATVSGEKLEMDKVYTDQQGRDFTVESFRFYADNMTLHGADGSTQLISEFDLFDFNESDTEWTRQKTYENYERMEITGISFGLGLDPQENASDPATFEPYDPRSIYPGMYWTWATKYIFVKLEGRLDSNGDGELDGAYFYHVGLDKYYRTVSTIPVAVDQTNGKVGEIDITVDLMDVFFHPDDTIDMFTEGQTHTTNDEPLAERFIDNLSTSFKAE